MIRLLSLLLLVSAVVAETQQCGDSSYTAYFGERLVHLKNVYLPFNDVWIFIDQFCQCARESLEAKGLSQDQPVECGINNDINKLKWITSTVAENSTCTDCMPECGNASSDPNTVCEFIRSSGPVTVPIKTSALALRIRIIIIIIIRRGSISIYIGIQ